MTQRMGRVICDIAISADGYTAGLNQTEERPFGDDGGDGTGAGLHAWMFDTPDENRAEIEQLTAARAFIMGRNMFGPVRGEWDRQWNGWWGDNPQKRHALAIRIQAREDDYLRFARDPCVPSDNNDAERTIRMSKLRIKISGCMRSMTGAPPGTKTPGAARARIAGAGNRFT